MEFTIYSGIFPLVMFWSVKIKKSLIGVKMVDYKNQIQQMLLIINNIINETDFSILYDNKKHLFSIGYDVEQGKLTNSYYDLLASEARQASLIAIAKKDIDVKNWYNLSRTLTVLNKYKHWGKLKK